MKRTTTSAAVAAFLAVSVALAGAAAANAQTYTQVGSAATGPLLYSQGGMVISGYNTSTGALNPGWYYTSTGQPIYYYANGTYYNPINGTYGGTVYYPAASGPSGPAPVYSGAVVMPTSPGTIGGTVIETGSAATGPTSVTVSPSATMPVFYNQAGIPVNNATTSAPLPAGYYYTSAGQPIYYYGNGTYYDPATGAYGGSTANPNGTAGVPYTVSSVNPSGSAVPGTVYGATPGAPNTGAGGNAELAWFTLIVSGVIAAAGVAYMNMNRIYFP